MDFLILTQKLKLGINKTFHLYSLSIKVNWFDFELCEGRRPLVELPINPEIGWDIDLLKVEYDLLVEESYLVLLAHVGNIGPFLPLVDDVNLPHLAGSYMANIRS